MVQEYNGQRVEGMEEFGRLVRETPPGREVKLMISRNGATADIDGGAREPQVSLRGELSSRLSNA